jgi:hypothetical protein
MSERLRCTSCGAETDHDPDAYPNVFDGCPGPFCDQCACEFAGICGACNGPCRGLAWPKNYDHIFPRWPT